MMAQPGNPRAALKAGLCRVIGSHSWDAEPRAEGARARTAELPAAPDCSAVTQGISAFSTLKHSLLPMHY